MAASLTPVAPLRVQWALRKPHAVAESLKEGGRHTCENKGSGQDIGVKTRAHLRRARGRDSRERSTVLPNTNKQLVGECFASVADVRGSIRNDTSP
jgi:hypothetical protein